MIRREAAALFLEQQAKYHEGRSFHCMRIKDDCGADYHRGACKALRAAALAIKKPMAYDVADIVR